jgi:sugar phosphate isomerase/epimerase
MIFSARKDYPIHISKDYVKDRSRECELCLDLGHLILGQEHVMDSLKRYLKFTRVIHLHGVKRYEDHLGLSILPKNLVHEWMIYLKKAPFQGEIVLEVFSPQDLKESLNIILETPCH